MGRCGEAKDQREGGPGQNAIKAPAWHVKFPQPPVGKRKTTDPKRMRPGKPHHPPPEG